MTRDASAKPGSVLITGASSGIGEACAVDLAAHGFRVFAGVRKPDDAARLWQKNPDQIVPIRIDVTDAAMIEAAVKEIAAAVGGAGLAGLVNNAGIAVAGPLELMPIENLRRQMEINFIGQVAVIQAMLPMLRAARGRIINMSSINGVISPPYFGPYSASKFALEAISNSLRGELRHWGIHVILIEPGAIDTPIWERSLRMADDLDAIIAAKRHDLYREDLDIVRANAMRMAAHAMPVKRVTDAVRTALTASRPRTRYPIGAGPFWALCARRVLPNRWLDYVIRKGLGLK